MVLCQAGSTGEPAPRSGSTDRSGEVVFQELVPGMARVWRDPADVQLVEIRAGETSRITLTR